MEGKCESKVASWTGTIKARIPFTNSTGVCGTGVPPASLTALPNQSFTSDRTFGELREATEIKENKIEQGEHSLHVMWECQWDQMVKTDTALQSFLTDLAIVSPLEPRDAFFGGRTNAATLHHEVDESIGEEIRYVDVTSLYPTVNKYDEYPIGHPTILTHPEDQDIAHYFGLAKVDALAPRQLYHPVLPHRSLGKLTFPLCRACVTEEMPKPFLERSPHCSHDDSERLFTGTWCTPELMEAVKQGYQIVRIHEVWHFPPDSAPLWTLCNLRQYLAASQARVLRLSFLGPNARTESCLRGTVQAKGRHLP